MKQRSRRAVGPHFRLGRVLAMIVTAVFVFGILVCNPAEHDVLESAAAAQMLTADTSTPDATRTTSDHESPAKKALTTCTSHCAAHNVSLPAALSPETIAFWRRTSWQPAQDHLPAAGRPALPDRPPRA